MPYVSVGEFDMYYEVHGDCSSLLLLHDGGGPIPEKWIPFLAPPNA